MKKTINKKGNPGMLRTDGRPDRTNAPLIKPMETPVVQSTPTPPKQFFDLRQGQSEKELASRPIEPPDITIQPSGNLDITPSGYPRRRRN